MTTFALITENDNSKLFERVKLIYSEDSCVKIDKSIILIQSDTEALAKQVCDRIQTGIEPHCKMQDYGRNVVFSITSYNGWHFRSMWDWLNTKGV
jgi:hypothetical protein